MDAKPDGLFHYRPLSDKERKNLAILELIRKKGLADRRMSRGTQRATRNPSLVLFEPGLTADSPLLDPRDGFLVKHRTLFRAGDDCA